MNDYELCRGDVALSKKKRKGVVPSTAVVPTASASSSHELPATIRAGFLDKWSFTAGGHTTVGAEAFRLATRALLGKYVRHSPSPIVVGGKVQRHKSSPISLEELLTRAPSWFEIKSRRASGNGKVALANVFSSLCYNYILAVQTALAKADEKPLLLMTAKIMKYSDAPIVLTDLV